MTDEPDTMHGPIRMWLVVLSDGRPERAVEVTGDRFLIGRGETCGLVLNDAKVSREHAAIVPGSPGRRLLYDLGSANGTLVNGRPIATQIGFKARPEKVAELWGEERLQFGDIQVVATSQDPRSFFAPERPAEDDASPSSREPLKPPES